MKDFSFDIKRCPCCGSTESAGKVFGRECGGIVIRIACSDCHIQMETLRHGTLNFEELLDIMIKLVTKWNRRSN